MSNRHETTAFVNFVPPRIHAHGMSAGSIFCPICGDILKRQFNIVRVKSSIEHWINITCASCMELCYGCRGDKPSTGDYCAACDEVIAEEDKREAHNRALIESWIGSSEWPIIYKNATMSAIRKAHYITGQWAFKYWLRSDFNFEQFAQHFA